LVGELKDCLTGGLFCEEGVAGAGYGGDLEGHEDGGDEGGEWVGRKDGVVLVVVV